MSQAAVALRLLGPRVPLMLKTAAFQSLGWTDESSKWDVKTALIVTTLRSIMSETTSSITKQQNFSLKDPGVKGQIWVSTVTLPDPGDDIRQLLFKAVDQMGETGQETYTKPALEPVEAEWTGYRAGVGKDEPVPLGLSETDKFNKMMEEVKSDVTILYFHGGAYYMMDPSSHRPTAQKLAKLTKGRALNVRYRLSPQHPFPAALLDCLIAYLGLLYPSPGSPHTPAKAEHIIFAGDSAGGNMCLALTLLLLHLKHTSQTTIRFHGQDVEIPLPGGVAPNSAWADMNHCLPSWHRNAHYDYLPCIQNSDLPPPQNTPTMDYPPCPIWPATPPRVDLYCEGSMLTHPLTSPLAAKPEAWKDAPPFFFVYGEEMLGDEGRIVAQRIARQGGRVWFEGFEAMPHVFAPIFEGADVGRRCFEGWAGWMGKVVEGGRDAAPLGGVWVEAKTLRETSLDVKELIGIGDEEVWGMMGKEKERRIRVYEEGLKGESARL